jgi:hypothetical protein
VLVARADIDDNKVSPKNAEVEARFRFERDLIGKKDYGMGKSNGHYRVSDMTE